MFEVLNHYMPKIKKSSVLNDLNLKKNEYFVVSAHREENIENDEKLKELINSLNKIIETYGYEIIFLHIPEQEKQLKEMI